MKANTNASAQFWKSAEPNFDYGSLYQSVILPHGGILMKRIVSTFLLCVIFLCPPFMPLPSWADGASVLRCGEYSYTLQQDGSAEIVEYTGNPEALELPASLDGHPVTSIGDGAFQNGNRIQSITIPDSIVTVGSNPFSSCAALEKLFVSPEHKTLAVIDGVLFSKPDQRLVCFPAELFTNFYSVPDGTMLIGDRAFFHSKHLVTVTIPGSVLKIGESAFSVCLYLEKVILSDGVREIGAYAFHLCEKLQNVKLPESITDIGRYAFLGCYKLSELSFPRSSTAIGEGAFLQVPLQQGG